MKANGTESKKKITKKGDNKTIKSLDQDVKVVKAWKPRTTAGVREDSDTPDHRVEEFDTCHDGVISLALDPSRGPQV